MTHSTSRIDTYAEFWLHYLREHRLRSCRLLHYFGTLLAISSLGIIILSGFWAGLWIPLIAGYGPAWVGHFFLEKNRPTTFQYPWWSFISDFKMLFYAITGRLDHELRRAVSEQTSESKQA